MRRQYRVEELQLVPQTADLLLQVLNLVFFHPEQNLRRRRLHLDLQYVNKNPLEESCCISSSPLRPASASLPAGHSSSHLWRPASADPRPQPASDPSPPSNGPSGPAMFNEMDGRHHPDARLAPPPPAPAPAPGLTWFSFLSCSMSRSLRLISRSLSPLLCSARFSSRHFWE